MTASFKIKHIDGNARTGVVSTAHGEIRTPAFMPVGTAATVKGMTPEAVAQTGADILLSNTYHLMLRPTAELVAKMGGLHKFMNWNKPILTDSGGFQVMSLSKLRKITEQGVVFRSHLDGSEYNLTPERSMEIQHLLGSDITMAFDECTPFPVSEEDAEKSMQLSMRWAQRSKDSFIKRDGYGLFGIVQGGVFSKLREQSADALKQIGFDGYAVGGLAVGEGQELMFEVLDYTMPHLPTDKPRYLMGVGKPDDIIGAVLRGVDMFDCVIPTRAGRFARAYTDEGEKNIRNAKFADDAKPLQENCSCPACTNYSRAYLHHLFKAEEMLGATLLTWHNLTFYQQLMQGVRDAISAQRLQQFSEEFLAKYNNSKQ
ncbi:MAG: tRNA guanosine(34) transglycosylase Tgt [Rickettsiales bacterium]|jgi:queuine tRNA-ribosyltransferase